MRRRRRRRKVQHEEEEEQQYLDALQPPPDGVPAVVACGAAAAQQVWDQAVAQRPRETQDHVATETGGGVRGGWRNTHTHTQTHTHTHTYRASRWRPVSSIRPRRAMKESRPQQRKIPEEK